MAVPIFFFIPPEPPALYIVNKLLQYMFGTDKSCEKSGFKGKNLKPDKKKFCLNVKQRKLGNLITLLISVDNILHPV